MKRDGRKKHDFFLHLWGKRPIKRLQNPLKICRDHQEVTINKNKNFYTPYRGRLSSQKKKKFKAAITKENSYNQSGIIKVPVSPNLSCNKETLLLSLKYVEKTRYLSF